MSTTYQALSSPITSLRVDKNGNYFDFAIRVSGQTAGTLFLRSEEEVRQLLHALAGNKAFTRSAGIDGPRYEGYNLALLNKQYVSEYGELVILEMGEDDKPVVTVLWGEE